MLVRQIVGQLQLVEGDNLLHPLLPRGGAVRVDVHSLRHLGVRLARNQPSTEIKALSGENIYILQCTVHYIIWDVGLR